MFTNRKSTPERRSLPARTGRAARDLARRSLGLTRDTVHRELLERARVQEELSDEQIWRRYQFRHLAAFITIPAVILGTASIATAYGTGLMSSDPAPPACQPVVVAAPPAASFRIKVLNASGQNGAASLVAKNLARRGFTVVEASSAPRTLYVRAPVRIYHGRAGLDHALLAAQTVAGAELEYDGRAGTSISFVLGADFTTMLPAPPPKPPAQKSYKVNVYNATWRPGLAKSTLTELTARGFNPGKQGNDPDQSFLPNDVAVIRHGPDADLAAAQVAKHIEGAVLSEVPRDNLVIDVVLGNKFEQVTPWAEVPLTPVRKDPPPTVSRPCD
ncbi:LytR C-terminal domain-containing protein [Knoellia locipacati]|uniref:LytR C-terminal domain-containing protein n=1 Tax=Knoellia locipacati TaxID=882824 RepID=UPI00384C00CD